MTNGGYSELCSRGTWVPHGNYCNILLWANGKYKLYKVLATQDFYVYM